MIALVLVIVGACASVIGIISVAIGVGRWVGQQTTTLEHLSETLLSLADRVDDHDELAERVARLEGLVDGPS